MRLVSVGCGNMAGALLSRWLGSAVLSAAETRAVEATREGAGRVEAELGITCGTTLVGCAAGADVVLIAVKPQQRAAVLQDLARLGGAGPGTLWLSIMAGVELAELEASLGPASRVVRWMPNTPVRVGAGVVGSCLGSRAGAEAERLVQRLAEPLGLLVPVLEAQLDALTAISGCGPAYLFHFCEALQAAGVSLGFEEGVAEALARATTSGAARLLDSSSVPAATLRAQVTSKGGMTEAALAHLMAEGWAATLETAADSARKRADVLAGRAPLDE